MLPAGLTPSDVVCWYEARHGGGQVHPLPDVSGNGQDIAQPDVNKQAVHEAASFNGQAVYRFGTPRLYRRQWPTFPEPYTVFLVADISELRTTYTLFSGWNRAGKHMVGLDRGTRWVMEQAGIGQHIYSNKSATPPAVDTRYVLQAEFGPVDTLTVNGQSNIIGDAGHNPSIGITLGAREDSTRHWPGRIAVCGITVGLSEVVKDTIRAELLTTYRG